MRPHCFRLFLFEQSVVRAHRLACPPSRPTAERRVAGVREEAASARQTVRALLAQEATLTSQLATARAQAARASELAEQRSEQARVAAQRAAEAEARLADGEHQEEQRRELDKEVAAAAEELARQQRAAGQARQEAETCRYGCIKSTVRRTRRQWFPCGSNNHLLTFALCA